METRTAEKLLSEAIKQRRATPSFDGTPVPDEDLKKILQAGLEAPSGYNLQPWRFVVVRDAEARKRLRAAAMGQPKVEEAPVVIVACGDPEGWKSGDMEEMLRLAESLDEGTRNVIRQNLNNFLGAQPGDTGGVSPDFGGVGEPAHHDRPDHHDVDGGNTRIRYGSDGGLFRIGGQADARNTRASAGSGAAGDWTPEGSGQAVR